MLFLFFLEWWKKKNDLPSVQSICKVWDFDPVTIDVTDTTQEEKEKAELLLWRVDEYLGLVVGPATWGLNQRKY
jgi:hypothetical protein